MDDLASLLAWGDITTRLLAAVGAGGVIGINRELRQKPAGLRTHALVALGAATIMVVTEALVPSSDRGSATRAIQGIITGIGFIGAGVILHRDGGGEASIRGLTTAATIWIAACLGTACGLGLWRITAVVTLLAVAVLILGEFVEQLLYRLFGLGKKQGGEQR
jgi:putative Mg2+ transporter-C (MgtC) family protein